MGGRSWNKENSWDIKNRPFRCGLIDPICWYLAVIDCSLVSPPKFIFEILNAVVFRGGLFEKWLIRLRWDGGGAYPHDGITVLLQEKESRFLALSFSHWQTRKLKKKKKGKKKSFTPELQTPPSVPLISDLQHPELGKINFCYLSFQSIIFC